MKNFHSSVINYRELRAQKARLGLTNADIIEMTNTSTDSVSAVMNGAETVNLQTLIKIADALSLNVRIEFEPKAEESKSELRLVA